MQENQYPLVSIGIPLYRARPFVVRILDNIKGIDYPNVEYLIADQHCLDDAIQLLRGQLPSSSRVRFFETADQLPWFDNYSFLLRNAVGRYFRLLAQDDSMPPNSIAHAVRALERDPSAVVAYGPVQVVDIDGALIADDRRAYDKNKPWSRWQSLVVFAGTRYGGATHGIIRRRAYAENDLFLPPTHAHTGLSFRVLFFALSLRGRFYYVSQYITERCVHPDSFTSIFWNYPLKDQVLKLLSYYRVALKFWRRSTDSWFERWIAGPVLLSAATITIPCLRFISRLSSTRYTIVNARKAGRN